MRFYKNASSYRNYSKLKSILSIFTMGLFIFFGFASIDEGDPTTRILPDCEFLKPHVSISHRINFDAKDEEGKPPPLLIMTVYIKDFEKVDDNSQCTLVLKNAYTRTFSFNSSGQASLTLSKSYVSNDDELEIYFEVNQAGYYNQAYSHHLKKSSEAYVSTNFAIHLRKDNQYP